MYRNKIALIGASGFLGNQILLDLVNNGYKVTIVFNKVNDRTVAKSVKSISLKKFISSQEKYDFIVNCAGYYSKSTTPLEIYKVWQGNYVLVKKLIRYQKINGGSLITFGSYFEHITLWNKLPARYYAKYKIKARKKLTLAAQKNPFPIFYIYLFDTYGEEDTRNKVLTFIIREFKSGRIPDLKTSFEVINWSHKADISESIIKLMKNSEKYSCNTLHEFQIRSCDEFRLIDFVEMIATNVKHSKSICPNNSKFEKLRNCAPNLEFFKAKENVLNFAQTMIAQK